MSSFMAWLTLDGWNELLRVIGAVVVTLTGLLMLCGTVWVLDRCVTYLYRWLGAYKALCLWSWRYLRKKAGKEWNAGLDAYVDGDLLVIEVGTHRLAEIVESRINAVYKPRINITDPNLFARVVAGVLARNDDDSPPYAIEALVDSAIEIVEEPSRGIACGFELLHLDEGELPTGAPWPTMTEEELMRGLDDLLGAGPEKVPVVGPRDVDNTGDYLPSCRLGPECKTPEGSWCTEPLCEHQEPVYAEARRAAAEAGYLPTKEYVRSAAAAEAGYR